MTGKPQGYADARNIYYTPLPWGRPTWTVPKYDVNLNARKKLPNLKVNAPNQLVATVHRGTGYYSFNNISQLSIVKTAPPENAFRPAPTDPSGTHYVWDEEGVKNILRGGGPHPPEDWRTVGGGGPTVPYHAFSGIPTNMPINWNNKTHIRGFMRELEGPALYHEANWVGIQYMTSP